MIETLLIIEDEKLLGSELSRHYRQSGWDVVLAATLAEAKTLLLKNRIEPLLILSDMNLPDGNALDFMEAMNQPGKTFILRLLNDFSLFVFPMGGDPFLCNLMHFMGSNLDLDPLPIRSDRCGMKGLIHVFLRKSNVVLEFSRNGFPKGVDDP